ncbi:MAG: hypothetical protein ACE37H_14475 [Phycisphaeraceae bacterium]
MRRSTHPTAHPHTTVTLHAIALIVLALLAVSPAAGQEREDPYEGLDRDQRRVYQAYTRLFCEQFFRFGDKRFVILPNHDRKRENSSGRTYDQAFEQMTITRTIRRNGAIREVKEYPEPAEVIADAKVIPAIDVGHFGYIHSATIKDILGPDEMIIESIVLITKQDVGKKNNTLRKKLFERQKQYEGKTHRLLGFDTKGLKPGQTFAGPAGKGIHLAVMSTDRTHGFVLVNFDKLQRVRTTEFTEVLDYVDLEPLVFIDMVRDNRERLSTKGDQASLISIYRRFYNRYTPKRVTAGPAIRPETTDDNPADPSVGDRPATRPDDEPADQPETDTPGQPDPPTPDEQPRPQPQPVPDRSPDDAEDEDDWEYDETGDTSPDEPNFFGIPF